MQRFYRMAEAQNKHFPNGVEPYQIFKNKLNVVAMYLERLKKKNSLDLQPMMRQSRSTELSGSTLQCCLLTTASRGAGSARRCLMKLQKAQKKMVRKSFLSPQFHQKKRLPFTSRKAVLTQQL